MPKSPRAVRPLDGGLFTALLRLVRLDDNSPKGVRRRVAVIASLAWLPLLVLAAPRRVTWWRVWRLLSCVTSRRTCAC